MAYDLVIVPQPLSNNPVEVTIKQGMNTSEIAELLKHKKVIRNPYFFIISAKLNDVGTQLKAGSYDLRENMENEEIFAILSKGPARKVFRITVPEGLTIEQTAARVASQSDIDKDVFFSIVTSGGIGNVEIVNDAPWPTYEGFLFPKTYEIFEDTQPEQLVQKMLEQFAKETKAVDWRLAESWGLNKYEIIVIASLIEREAKLTQERTKVSAIIHNRLEKGMPLQIDATVQYALGNINQQLTTDDLKVDSPYNTYTNQGLPPGPICSPRLDSIQAALHPDEADYIYYVLTGKDGSHTFTSSYDDFLKAKAEAKKALR